MLAVLLAALWLPAQASAGSLPTLLSKQRCEHSCSKVVGVYRVRPRTVILAEAAGGDLVVDWASWTKSAATGSGTATSSGMGTTTTLQVSVRAWRVRHGTFTRLTITDRALTGPSAVETLRLSTAQQDWLV